MKNIPKKYHPAVRKLIKKAREDEQKKTIELLEKNYGIDSNEWLLISSKMYKNKPHLRPALYELIKKLQGNNA